MDLSKLIDKFTNFKKEAFRLELLQKYDVEFERESFLEFLKTGKLVADKTTNAYSELITKAKKRGAEMKRIHVIKLPLSDYLLFEIAAYKFNIDSGEKVYLLLQEDFERFRSKINYDFWLFDDNVIFKMNYDVEGKFLGLDEVTEDISEFIELKNKLLSEATLLEKFNFEHETPKKQ